MLDCHLGAHSLSNRYAHYNIYPIDVTKPQTLTDKLQKIHFEHLLDSTDRDFGVTSTNLEFQ